MKRMLKSMMFGVSISCVLFVLFSVYYDIKYQGNFHLEEYMFSKMALGSILIGVGFALPTAIYDTKLPYAYKASIHMGIGCICMVMISSLFGFLDTSRGVLSCFILLFVQIFIAIAIWCAFYCYYKSLAKAMNAKIKEHEH